jgi:hypothetical protein
MIPCRLVEALASFIPLRKTRDSLLLHHAEKCRICQQKLLSKQEAHAWICDEINARENPDFWSVVEDKIRGREQARLISFPSRLSYKRKWAVGAGVTLLIATGFLIIRNGVLRPVHTNRTEPVRFQLTTCEIDGEAIIPIIIQPADPDFIIICTNIKR